MGDEVGDEAYRLECKEMLTDFYKEFEVTVPISKPCDDDIVICKVGNEERPASPEDIAQVQNVLIEANKRNDVTIVTHHALEFLRIPRSSLKNLIVVGNLDGLLSEIKKI